MGVEGRDAIEGEASTALLRVLLSLFSTRSDWDWDY